MTNCPINNLLPSVALVLATLSPTFTRAASPVDSVNPLIGTGPSPTSKVGWSFGTGNVFPGAVCPRGIVAWSPDTSHRDKIAGGYWYPDNKIENFSLTHFSGRGVISLMNVGFLPIVQPLTTSPGTHWTEYGSTFSHKNESATVGTYKVKFDNGIETQLTATPRSGMGRFTFPASSGGTLLLRANGSIRIEGKIATGYAESKLSNGRPYKTFFYAQFSSSPKGVKTWVGDKVGDAASVENASCGGVLTFAGPTVEVRVGISYTSLKNAEDNLKQENSSSDFAVVQKNAVELWATQLGRIEIEGGTNPERTIFYTALYHCFMHPNYLDDANGQYLGMDAKVHAVEPGHHQYQNIPAWDEHRSHSPLMAIIVPEAAADVMQSLVNYSKQDASVRPNGGGMPRWQQVNLNTGGMIGDGDCSIVSTTYAFGVKNFDAKGAFEALDRGASQFDVTAGGSTVRSGLKEYLSLGYVPDNAATTLEYCTDDFALAQLAKSLGEDAKAMNYWKRSQNWKNIFDKSVGLMRPKSAKGVWLADFSPAATKGFTEGTAGQYVWLVNHDLRGLIDRLGGNEKAVEKLDHFFTKTNAGYSNTEFAYMGNEPCEETPWIYDFAGAPARTQAVVRRIQSELFTDQPDGFPGNDDAGSISSWYIFSALGIYPEIPGVAGFVVGSPVFPKATVHLADGKTLHIVGDHATEKGPYVRRLKLDGKPYASPWIPWSAISDGGTLEFDLANTPSKWGSDPKLAPPSFGRNEG